MTAGLCTYCACTLSSSRVTMHALDCPYVTGLYPAEEDQVCTNCDEGIDYYTHVSVGQDVVLCCCLGCAAQVAVDMDT